ncbi:MAG: 16S rRNA (cytosine(1402)-N(4))-methyltransferase RsmH [Actinobacteria bacterium]|nr:16S rRNA (cytosine(1402)-N(4))-methyltransferase RsmH [Actinomycetota bacterium]
MDQDRQIGEDGYHRPVLAEEVVGLIEPVTPGVVVDATFGGGGHTRRLLAELGDEVTIFGIDRDPEAVANARELGVTVVKGNFADMESLLGGILEEAPAAVLLDLGVSSWQLDTAERGFSYHGEGPLDMRMGPDTRLAAHQIVNEWDRAEIARIIRELGEDPMAERIARAIIENRPIETTTELSTVIAAAVPAARRRAGHPARRTFQAIRIAVNRELDSLRQGLEAALSLVKEGGRVIVISYHSLEDRIVKQRFASGARGCTCPPDMPVCGCGNTAELRLLTRKPVRPGPEEIESNRRARSAVLRAAERLAA